jgi:hypothetical protein
MDLSYVNVQMMDSYRKVVDCMNFYINKLHFGTVFSKTKRKERKITKMRAFWVIAPYSIVGVE